MYKSLLRKFAAMFLACSLMLGSMPTIARSDELQPDASTAPAAETSTAPAFEEDTSSTPTPTEEAAVLPSATPEGGMDESAAPSAEAPTAENTPEPTEVVPEGTIEAEATGTPIPEATGEPTAEPGSDATAVPTEEAEATGTPTPAVTAAPTMPCAQDEPVSDMLPNTQAMNGVAPVNDSTEGFDFCLNFLADSVAAVSRYSVDGTAYNNGQSPLNLTVGEHTLSNFEARPGYIAPNVSISFTVTEEGKINYTGNQMTKVIENGSTYIFDISGFTRKAAQPITLTASAHGSAQFNVLHGFLDTWTQNASSAVEGDTVYMDVTTDQYFMVRTLSIQDASGKSISYEESTSEYGDYYFTMPDSAVSISLTLGRYSSITQDEERKNVTISFFDKDNKPIAYAWSGDTVYVHIKPLGGCEFTQFIAYVNGSDGSVPYTMSESGDFSFTMPACDVTVDCPEPEYRSYQLQLQMTDPTGREITSEEETVFLQKSSEAITNSSPTTITGITEGDYEWSFFESGLYGTDYYAHDWDWLKGKITLHLDEDGELSASSNDVALTTKTESGIMYLCVQLGWYGNTVTIVDPQIEGIQLKIVPPSNAPNRTRYVKDNRVTVQIINDTDDTEKYDKKYRLTALYAKEADGSHIPLVDYLGNYTFQMPDGAVDVIAEFEEYVNIYVEAETVQTTYDIPVGKKFLDLGAELSGIQHLNDGYWLVYNSDSETTEKVTAETVVQDGFSYYLIWYVDNENVLHIINSCSADVLPEESEYSSYIILPNVFVQVNHNINGVPEVRYISSETCRVKDFLKLITNNNNYDATSDDQRTWYVNGTPLNYEDAYLKLNTAEYSCTFVLRKNSMENGDVIMLDADNVPADSLMLNTGETVNLSIEADEGYELTVLRIHDLYETQDVEITQTDNGYSFVMPAYDVHISALFEELLEFTVNGVNGEETGRASRNGDQFLSMAEENGWNGFSENKWILLVEDGYVDENTVIHEYDYFVLAYYIDAERTLHVRYPFDATELPAADKYDQYVIENDANIDVVHEFGSESIRFTLSENGNTHADQFGNYEYNGSLLENYRWAINGEALDLDSPIPLTPSVYSLQSFTVTIPASAALEKAGPRLIGSLTITLDTTNYKVPNETIQVNLDNANYCLSNGIYDIPYMLSSSSTGELQPGDAVLEWNYSSDGTVRLSRTVNASTTNEAASQINALPDGEYEDTLTFLISINATTDGEE